MDRPRLKLQEFHVTVGPTSQDLPVCHEVMYTVALADEHGRTVERKHLAFVYEGLLSDSDQVPWLVAHALRTLLRGGE
jgi:hypothetical protein